MKHAGLNKAVESRLSDLYQRKALPELAEFTQEFKFGADFYTLGRYASDLDALQANLSAEIFADEAFKQAFEALKTTQVEIQVTLAKSAYWYRCCRACVRTITTLGSNVCRICTKPCCTTGTRWTL